MSGSRKSNAKNGSSKTMPFALRLTDDERRELSRRAGEMAMGSYIRAVLFSNEGRSKRPGSAYSQPKFLGICFRFFANWKLQGIPQYFQTACYFQR